MHTSALKFDHFDVEVDGASSTVPDLFPPWHKHQRFGVVIQEPLGHVGASLLAQAATAAFFDHLFANSWADMPAAGRSSCPARLSQARIRRSTRSTWDAGTAP